MRDHLCIARSHAMLPALIRDHSCDGRCRSPAGIRERHLHCHLNSGGPPANPMPQSGVLGNVFQLAAAPPTNDCEVFRVRWAGKEDVSRRHRRRRHRHSGSRKRRVAANSCPRVTMNGMQARVVGLSRRRQPHPSQDPPDRRSHGERERHQQARCHRTVRR